MLRMDLEALQNESFRADIRPIASYLQDTLGQKITAYLSGLSDPKVVGLWVAGKNRPRAEKEMRLRTAYQLVKMIATAYDPSTARAWLFGTNTRLSDRAPASVLRKAAHPHDLENLIPTARAFAGAAD